MGSACSGVLEFFSILELETLKLNTYGNTNNKNIKNIYILTQCSGDRQYLGALCGFPASGRIVRECCHRVLSGMEIICV